MRLARLVAFVTLVACGSAKPVAHDQDQDPDDSGPFEPAADFKPKAFGVEVSGAGRPIIFIPGLGCPGEVWAETVEHLANNYETHVLTLSGFAGRAPINEPLSAAVRRDLTRYIRSNNLKHPIIVGHSMGGFIAYWIASYHPELVGPVIIVDASPALSGDLEDAKQLRLRWKNASDEVYERSIRAAFRGMTSVAPRMAPVIERIARSDRRAIGEAIYEMMTTNLLDKVQEIQSPVLVVAADGAFKTRIRAQIETIPDHQMIVVPRARHFVMWDDPEAWFAAIDEFLAHHP